MLLAAFKTSNDILAIPPKFIFSPTLDNFIDALARDNTVSYFFNSIYISLGSVFLATIVSFIAAYAFSRYNFRATNFLMFLLLSTRMVPAAAALIPIFQMFSVLEKSGIPRELLIFLLYASFSIPFSIWILKGFIDGVSQRFDETGLVNGATRIHIIFRVVLPQVWPGIIAAFIFNLIFVWNEFLFNFILGSRTTQMIPYALNVGLVDAGGNFDWAFVASLSTAYVLLPMVMIFFFQKYLLVGMTFGTVRGEV
ncbi:MAG: carbohydrate ABC transporter permease [Chloroflexota bacterium]